MLEMRALGAYDIYLGLMGGLAGDAATDLALLEQVATSEHAQHRIDERRSLSSMGGTVEGTLRIESFALLTGIYTVHAHVCHGVSEQLLVDTASGEVLTDGAPERELLIGFVMHPDGRMLVSQRLDVTEEERTCP